MLIARKISRPTTAHQSEYDARMEEKKPHPLEYAPPPAKSAVALWRKIFSGILFIAGGVQCILGWLQSNPAARTNICLVGITLILAAVIFRFPKLRIF
jgi:hypothetical protein